uniref:protein FAM136A n=1 Tax=Urocitellus parryii TaxID=9999 RepID=UPI000E55EBF4|nr:protein FAM136A [Urocitellus parryii]
MAEVQQLRVQEAVDSMVKSVERENIRKMQGLMFRCSASCCEDSQASMQQVHQCIERCHAPLAQAQALVTSELEKFQDRLARCTMHCNDKAKDSIDAGNKELQVKRQLNQTPDLNFTKRKQSRPLLSVKANRPRRNRKPAPDQRAWTSCKYREVRCKNYRPTIGYRAGDVNRETPSLPR